VERAIQILCCFKFGKKELTIENIMLETGLTRATVYRLLWTLEKNGMIQYDSKLHSFRLGYKLLEFGNIVFENLDIGREAESEIKTLNETIHQSVILAVRQEDHLQYILRVDSQEGFQPHTHVGSRKILHMGAIGTAMMAYLPVEQAAGIIDKYPLIQLTPYTLTDTKNYIDRLAEIRLQGYFVGVEETFVGFTTIAVPIFDAKGIVTAGLGTIVRSHKLDDEYLAEIIKQCKNTAMKISRKLGFIESTVLEQQ